ncbi:hypothetical protein AB0K16_22460 [Nonomuraea jabiensis]|uniref:hypothetical protein n=1 Tax=Nonomuraea jabiensis TaxID=882448 RepID=UPI003432EDFB
MAGFDTVQVLTLLVGTVLPLLVGFVNKESASAGAKAVWLAVLSAVGGGLSSALDAVNAGVVWDWRSAIVTAVGTFLIAVGMHFGLWKPTGAAAAAQRSGVKG